MRGGDDEIEKGGGIKEEVLEMNFLTTKEETGLVLRKQLNKY